MNTCSIETALIERQERCGKQGEAIIKYQERNKELEACVHELELKIETEKQRSARQLHFREDWRDRYYQAQGELNDLKVALEKLLENKK